MIWSFLINDISIFISSIEYFWLLASLILALLCVGLHLYLIHTFAIQEVKDEKLEIDYEITNTWTPPILTWFVLCIRTSEDNDEDSLSPSLI